MNTQQAAPTALPGSHHLAWLGTDPIPAKPYYDPAWFELEREAVFKRVWLQIGHISEIAEAGSFMTRPIEVAGAALLIIRGKDGLIRAFHNVCTHRGTMLVEADTGRGSSFHCPYHQWHFNYDGALRSAPDFQRFNLRKEDCALRKVAVDVCGGLIFVNLDPTPAQGLREFLGPIADELDKLRIARATTFAEYVYEIDANWKVNLDNFLENYHLRFIHPRSGAPASTPDNPFGYPESYAFYGPHRSQQLGPTNPDGKISEIALRIFGRAAKLPKVDHAPTVPKADFKLFPNLLITGPADENKFFFSHCIMPLGPEKTRGTIRLYWSGEDDCASRRFLREYTLAQVRDIHAEDRVTILRSQKGLSTGALTHIHFQEHECLCRHSFNNVKEMIDAYLEERAAQGVEIAQ